MNFVALFKELRSNAKKLEYSKDTIVEGKPNVFNSIY